MNDHVKALLGSTLVCDMVLPYLPEEDNDTRILPLWKRSGFDFVSVHPAGDDHNISQAVQLIARARHHLLCDEEQRFVLVECVADIERAKAQNKLAVGIHLEGFRCLERNLDMIESYYALGVRFCHPIFNVTNSLGGGCMDGDDVGLTKFGRKVIAEMNRVGMMVDGAHAGYRSSLEMAELSEHPILMSHHGCYTLHAHPRNVRDEQIRMVAAKGGVIGISGAGFYLGGKPTVERYLQHIEHLVNVGGWHCAAIGLDYIERPDLLERFIRARPEEWPQGLWEPMQFFSPELLPQLVEAMLECGFSDEMIRGVLGENFLRVCRDVWK
jgi:membrane dipeptidase